MTRPTPIGFRDKDAAAFIGLGDDDAARKKFRRAWKAGLIPDPERTILGVDLWSISALHTVFPSNLKIEDTDDSNPWDQTDDD